MLKTKENIEKLEYAHKHLRAIKRLFKETSEHYLRISKFLEEEAKTLRSNPDIFDLLNGFISSNQQVIMKFSENFKKQSQTFKNNHLNLKKSGELIKSKLPKFKNNCSLLYSQSKKSEIMTYEKELEHYKEINDSINTLIHGTVSSICEEFFDFTQNLCEMVLKSDDVFISLDKMKSSLDDILLLGTKKDKRVEESPDKSISKPSTPIPSKKKNKAESVIKSVTPHKRSSQEQIERKSEIQQNAPKYFTSQKEQPQDYSNHSANFAPAELRQCSIKNSRYQYEGQTNKQLVAASFLNNKFEDDQASNFCRQKNKPKGSPLRSPKELEQIANNILKNTMYN